MGGKRYAATVTLIKPGERMNSDKKPGSFDQSPYQGGQTLTEADQLALQGGGIGRGVGGVKDDGGKLMWNLLPWKATQGLIKVLTFGAKKYAPNGWRTVPNAKERYQAALLRHLCSINAGEKTDPESGLRHIDHIMCNAAFLAELED
jgi:hypothetical protein